MNILQQITFYISSFLIATMPTTDFVEGVVGQPQSFLPHQVNTRTDRTISSLLFRGLFEYDIYGELQPDLADSWSIENDGLVYTVKLKDNQYWSDGTKITADDLIYTAFKSQNLQDVASDKVDDLTVRFTLPNKYSPFLGLLTIGIMQSDAEENHSAISPVSSGQFRVLTITRSGPAVKEVVLLNQAEDPEFDKLIFRYYSNQDELVSASKLGEIDGFVHSKDIELENFQQYKFPLQGVYYSLFFNLRDEQFQDVELRRNLSKVLDVESIVYPYGITVEGPISRSLFTDESIDFNDYDEELKLDIDTSDDPLVITIPDLPQHQELSQRIKDIWEDRLGVDVKINPVAPERMNDEVILNRNFEILLYGQEISRDPDRYVNWHSTQVAIPGLNLSGFEHVRGDRALEEGRNESDNDERYTHYQVFQEVVSSEVPAIFLYHPFSRYYVSEYVEGIGEKYTFSVVDRFLDFNNWSKITTN